MAQVKMERPLTKKLIGVGPPGHWPHSDVSNGLRRAECNMSENDWKKWAKCEQKAAKFFGKFLCEFGGIMN
jgi:hypothetical protein